MDRYAVWISKNLLVISLIGIAAFSFNLFIFRDENVLIYDYKRLFISALVVLNSILIASSKSLKEQAINKSKNIGPKVALLLSTLILFAFISNIFGFYTVRGMAELLYFVGLFLLLLSFLDNKHNKLVFELVVLVSFLCYLSVAVGFLVSVIYGDGSSVWTILSYANPRMMNQVQIWLIIPCLYIAVISKSRKSLIPLALHFSLFFALTARGLTIAALSGIALWAIIDKKHRPKILKITLAMLVAGYAIKWFTLAPFPKFLITGELGGWTPQLNTSDSGRLEMWLYALQHISIIGHGGDAFVCNSPYNSRPHNSVLLVAFNWGVIASICYVLLIAILFFKVIFEKRTKTKMWGATLLSGIAYSFISGVLDSPLSQLLFISTLALYWQASSPLDKIEKRKPYIFLVLLCLCVTFSVSTRVFERVTNNFYLAEEHIPETYKPQFWYGNNCVDVKQHIK
ncbi:hypothetical protein JCM19232_31 [Vibrio ishigakensis]|uniref:Uncharacterized protein n=1 Tax=Vibrio ishigakensis TaxID=1481914 RepID=A0A0B8PJX7_9VIBR|nr:hypothetical protein JCM19232_31 [Vibrio ishigakensis]